MSIFFDTCFDEQRNVLSPGVVQLAGVGGVSKVQDHTKMWVYPALN